MLPLPLQRLSRAAITILAVLALPAGADAAVTTVGSPLSVQATLNTSQNLSYQGVNTPVPPNPEAPNGLFHTPHYGADTAIWNVVSKGGSAAMPTTGQAIQVRLEGCAQPAPGGPPPLTQFHVQDLSPLPGGGAHVNLTSQPFDIPICGHGGASTSTVSTFEPINLCVSQGDYVDFNDEGGYVPFIYRAGVPYSVLGVVPFSQVDSFIRGNGTDNGANLLASDINPMEGFAASTGEELMLQVVLGTGPDARYICGGGTKDAPPTLAPLHVRPQTDGVNHSGSVGVAIFCRPAGGCAGTATLALRAGGAPVASGSFNLPGGATGHLSLHLNGRVMALIRKHHTVPVTLTALFNGQTFTQTIRVGIL
jgi:hypothetical protein